MRTLGTAEGGMAGVPERRRVISLAGGSLWLALVGAVYAIWSLVAIGTREAAWAIAVPVALIAGLGSVGLTAMRRAVRLPKPEREDKEKVKTTIRRFWLIFGLEGLAILIGNGALAMTQHFSFIVALDLVIVGLHFFPLAKLFYVPRYNLMGLLFCAIPIATVVELPRHGHVGHALSWIVVPSLGCAAVSFAFAAAGFREVSGLLCAGRQA